MTNLELMKRQREFAKTPFGKRARIFSVIPFFIALITLIFLVLSRDNENALITILCLNSFCFSIIGTCITQLQYGKMLNDYLKEKNK